MNETAIITFLRNNFPTIMTPIKSVIGGLLGAIFLRHNTATEEFEKIKAGQFREAADDLLKSGKMTYTEYYKANNFLIVAEKADEYYSKTHHESNSTTYDFDWFIRFYEAVGSISDEAMQDLWAKILAGEIVEPSSFSLKTIDTLRNMSKKNAELFVKICNHSFMVKVESDSIFLPNNDSYLDECDIQYFDIMKLNEQGLIFNDSAISLNIPINKEPAILFTNNELIMTIAAVDNTESLARIRQYPFTEAGRELASVIAGNASDDDFINYGRCLDKENANYNIAVYKCIKWNENSVNHELKNLIFD